MTRTLSDEQILMIASAHDLALRTAVPIDPPTRRHPEMSLEDAYAIQAAWIDLQINAGAEVRGHKIGLTSRAMQQAMKIDEPDFGALLDYMFIESGATIDAAHHLDPKIEVEFAYVLRSDLSRGPDDGAVTLDDVLDATDHIVPALELIDARSHRVHPADGATRTVRDTIADNAADAGIVTGDHHIDPSLARAGELRWAGAILERNGIVEETGLGAGVLNDPTMGVVWLANRLHGLGIPLVAGETILAGSFTRPVDCRPGDEFRVDFGRFGVIELRVD